MPIWRDGSRYARGLRVPDTDYRGRKSFEHHVFICGLRRSGTTLLERYLTSRFRVCHLRAKTPESEGQHLQSVHPAAFLHGGPGRFAFDPAMSPKPPSPEDAPALRQRLLACWANYTVGDDPILLEKGPPNLTKIAWLRAVFPGARFIVLVRDPRAVAAATLKWSKQSLEEAMYHWNVAHSLAFEQIRDEDCEVVRYEEFCVAPDVYLDTSAILSDLPRRTTPLPLGGRVSDVSDANAKYLTSIPPRKFGRGAWQEAGYTI